MSKYGENIKKIRSVRGLTQAQLADIIDVSRGVISSYEEGRAEPKIETIIKTAEVFQVTVDALLKKNITVNQLSGFTLPELLKEKKQPDGATVNDDLADFFPKGVIIIKSDLLNENVYYKNSEVLFCLREAPVVNKLFIIELGSQSLIGKITDVAPNSIVLDGSVVQLKDITRAVKVIGVYQHLQVATSLEERLIQMEKRLERLEEQRKRK